MKRLFDFISNLWQRYRVNRDFKKRMKDLQKKDPFIYK